MRSSPKTASISSLKRGSSSSEGSEENMNYQSEATAHGSSWGSILSFLLYGLP